MNLWEITNGHIGESYVRCYAWAEDELLAVEMCVKKNGGQSSDYEAVRLFGQNDDAFCTTLNDGGWDRDR